jgi:hypothetical protein
MRDISLSLVLEMHIWTSIHNGYDTTMMKGIYWSYLVAFACRLGLLGMDESREALE